MVRFLIAAILLTAALMFGLYVGVRLQWFVALSFGFEIITFISLTTAILYRFLHVLTRTKSFIPAYLASIVFKLIVYCVFIFIVLYLDRPGAFRNAVLFMVSYLLFTVLEIAFLFRSVNR